MRDPLSEAAARRHELTRSKAIQALRELDRAGTPVTFAGVAQAAEVSRSWLYTQPDISGQIRRLRQKTDGAGGAGAVCFQPQSADLAADVGLGIEPRPRDPCRLGDAGERRGNAGPVELAQGLDGPGPGQLVPPGCGLGERVRTHWPLSPSLLRRLRGR